MKQLVQDLRSGETRLIEVPIPRPQPGTVLVRTAASVVSAGTERGLVEFAGRGLVGKARARPDLVRQTLDKARREGLLTTLEAVRNRLQEPLPLGYASAGTVVEVGEGIADLRPGDRVACAGGGYAVHAEYAVVPRNLLARLPEAVDFESAAFTTLGAIALHGFRLAEPQLGERLAVIGLGLLGRLAGEVARAAGCAVFGVDVEADRVRRAREAGVAAALRSEAEAAGAAFAEGRGFDVVLICADTPSSDPVELAATLARDRARVVVIGNVGMEVPRRLYYEKELTLTVARSYGPGRYDAEYEEKGRDYPIGYVRWTEGRNLEAFVELLAEGRVQVRPLITHRFPIERAPEAYALLQAGGAERPLGVVLTYPAEAPPASPAVRLSARPVAASAPLRLGALGAGNFARNVLFPVLRRLPGVELVGLASGGGPAGVQAARRHGFRYATSDEAELLADPEINAVAVLTRHHLHARQVVAALQAGKHVFCEKPLALKREELAAIAEALAAADRLLMVGFNRRFAPLARELKAFFEPLGGPLALHYRVNAGPLPPDHWLHDPEQGGGRLIGEACHFVDFLTFLVGEPPQRVHARALPDDARYRQDNVLLTLEFPDGSLGTVAYLAAGDRAFPKERVEVFGGGRAAALDDFRRLDLVAGGRRRTRRAWLRQDKGHRGAWEAFTAAVAAGGPPPIPYRHLFGVTLATFAAVESLRRGEPVAVEGVLFEG